VEGSTPKNEKDSSVLHHGIDPQRELRSPTIWRVSTTPNDHYPVPTGLTTGPLPGIAKQIISTIKTIRKKN
jgi:hypothetical protein